MDLTKNNTKRQIRTLNFCGESFDKPAKQISEQPFALIIHDELLALAGMAKAIKEAGLRVDTLDIDRLTSKVLDAVQAPDLCILGNLDACDSELLRDIRRRFPSTRIILFDIDIRDDQDLTYCAAPCRAMGFDNFLPAFSRRSDLTDRIHRLFTMPVATNDASIANLASAPRTT